MRSRRRVFATPLVVVIECGGGRAPHPAPIARDHVATPDAAHVDAGPYIRELVDQLPRLKMSPEPDGR